MGKESKEMYQEEFASLFQLFTDASAEGQNIFPGWKNINFSNPAAAIQKVLGIGGAAKVWKFFCHCCSLTSGKIATPNEGDAICEICCEKKRNNANWKCFCQYFCSAEQTRKYKEALDELMTLWDHDMKKVRKEGKLKLGLENNKYSVDFVPTSVEESMSFAALLKKEMCMRSRSTLRKDINQMQAELKECLLAEQKMTQLLDQISQASTREQAIDKIIKFVPCIMHCENRVCIKVLTMILIEGLNNHQAGNFDGLEEQSMKEREENYIKKVEKVVRSSILGSYGSEAQWVLPVHKTTNGEESILQIGTINMENYKARRCVDMIEEIIEILIPDKERREKLKFSIGHYTKLMEIMRKKEGNYTNEELNQFREHSMQFYQSWIELFGYHRITNYIHMIGVGHMLEYMQQYGNLNRYSQQGWEALNALIKLFFFRRTNKGGKNSGESVTNLKSKLVPIGRRIQIRLLWVCNLSHTTCGTQTLLCLHVTMMSTKMMTMMTSSLTP